MPSSKHGWPALAVAVALSAGCASQDTPPPKAEFARAELALEQAAAADAGQYAPLPLRDAREKFEQARSALYNEDYPTARRLAEQAQVDAQLALTEAQTARSERLAKESMRSVETLREELQRKEGAQ